MAVDRTLVQIRERSYLDILDLALVVIRHRPATIGGTAALGIAPWAALNAWLTAGSGESRAALQLALIALEAPLATAPLTVVLGGLMFGSRPRAGRVAATTFRQLGPMVLYQGALRGLLLASIVLAWLVPARFAFLNEVVLLERGRWWKAWSRCGDLSNERRGELFGQWLAQVAFGSMFVLAFWLASARVLGVFEGELTWARPGLDLVFNAWAVLGIWVAVAFFAVARFLAYIDQRIRLEGWEVELRLRAVGRTMQEGQEAW
ncbi:hypothetical protein [Tautonia plasticadhaerens]|uniref:Uncharacterized protein n=1 Tax=Tautonia plasticadhaerens TaxID=2527974 RepID=A0A518H058_9BACT|nr:hypothetical protein [Tautonia plasticadhaerens]QDV34201.1 hypothetical protein ElP_20860 [Tautonia plasticadhaerens]